MRSDSSDTARLLGDPQSKWDQLAPQFIDDLDQKDKWAQMGISDMHQIEGNTHELEEPALEELESLRQAHEALKDMLRKNADKDTEEDYNNKLAKLKELTDIWDKISPQKFVVTVSVLGKDSKDYLKLLSFELDDEDWPVAPEESEDPPSVQHDDEFARAISPGEKKRSRKEWQWLNAARVEKAYSYYCSPTLKTFPSWQNRIDEHKNFKDTVEKGDAWEKVQPCIRKVCGAACRNFWEYFFDPPKVTHTVYWTTASRLLFDVDYDAQFRMVKALQNCGDDSESFNSIIPRIISRRAWDRCCLLFTLRVLQDIVQLMLSSFIIYRMVTQSEGPTNVLRIIVMLSSVRSMLLPMTDVSLMLCHYGRRDGFNSYFSSWNVFVSFCELVSAVLMFDLMFRNFGKDVICDYKEAAKSTCLILEHSVQFVIAMGLKWVSVMFEIMCAPGFGQTVLPAFYAVICEDSRYFLAFLSVIVMGTFHSYWSLPIPENMPKDGRSHLTHSFMKLFKLDFLGDVNMFDFEGIDEAVEITKKAGNSFTGSVDDGNENPLYHDAILILIVFLVIIVSILVMNVAIGVVGEAYAYNKSNANQLWCHYRSGYVVRLLLRRQLWDRLCPCLMTVGLCDTTYRSDVLMPVPVGVNLTTGGLGIFIGCHEAWFMDANDTKETLRDIISKEKSITEQIMGLKGKINERIKRAVAEAVR